MACHGCSYQRFFPSSKFLKLILKLLLTFCDNFSNAAQLLERFSNSSSSQAIKKLPFNLKYSIHSRSRGIASGFAAAFSYILGFISRKTYYDLESTLSLPGLTLFYCVVAMLGLILMFKIMPETESRSLEDIELHYSDNSKNISDHKISKSRQRTQSEDVENLI